MDAVAGTPEERTPLVWRVVAGVAFLVGALSLAAFIGQQAQQSYGLSSAARGLLQGIVMSGLVVPGIWWLRRRIDRRPLAEVGLEVSGRNLGGLAIGLGFVVVPVASVLGASRLFGWATIAVDTSSSGLWGLAIGLLTVFLFEALPEELAVRGYLYRNLSAVHARWKASILAVLLFITMPILGVAIQHYLLGMEIQVNGASSIQPSYLVIMLVFGSFQQYLRVLSGTIWLGVGFHTAFILINRIMGPRDDQMIRFAEVHAGGPLQLVAMASVGLILVTVFAWPWLARRSLGWREVERERG